MSSTCQKCWAGQMEAYEKRIRAATKASMIRGMRCSRCGFTTLEEDADVWSAVGL